MKKVNIQNKKAKFEYDFIEKFTAGLKLLGTEIKSIREGKASIKEGYCSFENDELFIYNMHITEYENASFTNHEPTRKRKLLLNRRELDKMKKKVNEKGFTIVPTRLFISDKGFAKLNIALAKGKKIYDKRESIKRKDDKRKIDRALKDI
jgi:SsrA-binding protein